MNKSDMVEVVRYLRKKELYEATPDALALGNFYKVGRRNYTYSPSNQGGITFQFVIDQSLDELHFSYAICLDSDNFDPKIGTAIARGRYEAGQVYTIKYDRAYSLVDNVRLFLADEVGFGNYKKIGDETIIFVNDEYLDLVDELVTLQVAINDILNHNEEFDRLLGV